MISKMRPTRKTEEKLAAAFKKFGDAKRAISLLIQLKERGLKPTPFVYNSVMHGFLETGRLDEILRGYRQYLCVLTAIRDENFAALCAETARLP